MTEEGPILLQKKQSWELVLSLLGLDKDENQVPQNSERNTNR